MRSLDTLEASNVLIAKAHRVAEASGYLTDRRVIGLSRIEVLRHLSDLERMLRLGTCNATIKALGMSRAGIAHYMKSVLRCDEEFALIVAEACTTLLNTPSPIN